MQALKMIVDAEKILQERFKEFEAVAYSNQIKVLESFRKYRVRENCFAPTSGYGYGDMGRDTLEEIYADIFRSEDALVRGQIVSGTHAIAACLFGLLRPGDELLSLTGTPYDTLANIIGIGASPPNGCLIERGIDYREASLTKNGQVDLEQIASAVTSSTKMVLIQRSRGYSLRQSLNVEQIKNIIDTVKQVNQQAIVMVDNCYGEFTGTSEPIEAGADIIAGSLIKNPGGGLALSGGYAAGKKELIEAVASHITAPGLGKELGSSLASIRGFYQGLFMAPHTVLQALKGSALISYLFEQYNYEVYPRWNENRGDIVQIIKLNSPENVLKFCQVIQEFSPVDSDVLLEYADMPGYTDQIVMAAGTFVQGSSIELSCDAPLRAPYCVFLQGGLTYEHVRYVAKHLLEKFIFAE